MKQRMYFCMTLYDLSSVIDTGNIIFNKISSRSKNTERVVILDGFDYFAENKNLKVSGKPYDFCDITLSYLYASKEIAGKQIRKFSKIKNNFLKLNPLYTDFSFKKKFYNLDKNIKIRNSLYENLEVLNTIDVNREYYGKG